MDEITALKQQVQALQLQNTQLMVRLVTAAVLLVAALLPWIAYYWSAQLSPASAMLLHNEQGLTRTNIQGLIKDQTPCSHPASPESPTSGTSSFQVGVMVLGASGAFLRCRTEEPGFFCDLWFCFRLFLFEFPYLAQGATPRGAFVGLVCSFLQWHRIDPSTSRQNPDLFLGGIAV